MHAGEAEQIEVAEMQRRQDEELENMRYVKPEPVKPPVKHDWTHHFKKVNQAAHVVVPEAFEAPSAIPCTHAPSAPKAIKSQPVASSVSRTSREESQSDILYEVITGVSPWTCCTNISHK
jgi:hypothetical protein